MQNLLVNSLLLILVKYFNIKISPVFLENFKFLPYIVKLI